jgi:SAM-dependent methyltransferase
MVALPSNPSPTTGATWSRLRWPLPALLTWLAGWLAWLGLTAGGAPSSLALGLALLVSAGLAWTCRRPWRRLLAAGGFPLSACALGASAGVPPWVWLLLLLPLLAAYPLRAWRDAPFFPTPADALSGLDSQVAAPARALDAGCGLGDGLLALRRLWPQAQLTGVEWSAPLAWLARLRCRQAGVRIRRGDMWAADWTPHDLVYVFQRPESMARVWAKAQRELRAGAWLVSLEFPVPGESPQVCLTDGRRRSVWAYRMPAPPPPVPAAQPADRSADNRD